MKKTIREENIMPSEKPKDEEMDSPDYFSRNELSKPAKVSEQVSRCLELRSVDMQPGYTEYLLDKHGEAHPQVVSLDSRKKYCGSVKILKLLLTPEIRENKKYKEVIEGLEKKEEEALEKFGYKERTHKKRDEKTDTVVWVYKENFYMPNVGAVLLTDDPRYPHSTKLSTLPGLWDDKVNRYWDTLVLIYDKMFGELSDLLHQLNYLEGTSTSG